MLNTCLIIKKFTPLLSKIIQESESDSALKPHYFVHPDAPTIFQGKDYITPLRWTVVPGAQGQITPKEGNFQTKGLLSNTILTHNSGRPDKEMGVSADVMHLNGLNRIQQRSKRTGHVESNIPSTDMHSLVVFEDRGEKIAAFTYHWLLSPGYIDEGNDIVPFCKVMKNASTFRQLITNLEPLDSFKNLLGELK